LKNRRPEGKGVRDKYQGTGGSLIPEKICDQEKGGPGWGLRIWGPKNKTGGERSGRSKARGVGHKKKG